MRINNSSGSTNLYIGILILFVWFLVWYTWSLGDESKFYIPEVGKTFSGRIIEKYYSHSPHIKIETSSGEVIDIWNVSDSLMKISRVGDSVYKFPNKDSIILYQKDNSPQKLEYMFIPSEVLRSKNWAFK